MSSHRHFVPASTFAHSENIDDIEQNSIPNILFLIFLYVLFKPKTETAARFHLVLSNRQGEMDLILASLVNDTFAYLK